MYLCAFFHSDNCLKYLRKAAHNLKRLDILGCPKITRCVCVCVQPVEVFPLQSVHSSPQSWLHGFAPSVVVPLAVLIAEQLWIVYLLHTYICTHTVSFLLCEACHIGLLLCYATATYSPLLDGDGDTHMYIDVAHYTVDDVNKHKSWVVCTYV